MTGPIIEARGLVLGHPDGTVAVRDASFTISSGEAVAIVGANGAGKSSLLLGLVGCLLPLGGSLTVAGHPVERRHLVAVRRAVGFVFQHPDDQLFSSTVAEDVAFGPRNLGLAPDEVERRVAAALRQVGAGHLAARPPDRLSGGEQRAVALSTVLAMDPQLLVLDEPSAGLDPRARRELIALLGGIPRTRVVATHDLDLALALCDRTIILDAGRIVADGPTAQLLADRRLLVASGLELPLGLAGCPVCGSGRSALCSCLVRSPG